MADCNRERISSRVSSGQVVCCPACLSDEMGDAVPIPDHEYALSYAARFSACRRCETLCQVPMPDGETLASFYPENYHSQTNRGALMRTRHAIRWRHLRGLLDGPGALLDYGCGNGAFLEWVAERCTERELFGYEISGRREVSKLAGGLVTIVKGDSEHLLSLLPPCRLITMNHVIEHLPDPFSAISAVAARLLPGGALEGQTPRSDSWEHQVFRTLLERISRTAPYGRLFQGRSDAATYTCLFRSSICAARV